MRKVLEVIWGLRKQKYFCKEGWTRLSTNRPTGKSAHGHESNPSFPDVQLHIVGAPTGRRSAPPDDRLRASPESITTIGSMDSGPAPSGASRNDGSELTPQKTFVPRPAQINPRRICAACQRRRALSMLKALEHSSSLSPSDSAAPQCRQARAEIARALPALRST